MATKTTGKALGGVARAASMTKEQRSASARKAALAKAENKNIPKATHGSSDHPLRIGDIEIPCYVLDTDTRVLSQRGLQTGLGMSASGGSKSGEQRLVTFLASLAEKTNKNNSLSSRTMLLAERLRSPLKFRLPSGVVAFGYEAIILADICDVILDARKIDGALHYQQAHIGEQAELLVRGFARVGIVALVDEATGYQKDRAKDALAKILEAWVAKELQPYVKTFPSDFYEHMFRLRGLDYPPERQNYRPQYFGVLTNDVVYERLAPGLLEGLKKQAIKDEKKAHLHRRLTEEIGHPRLKEHLASVVTIMKLSDRYSDFIEKLNRIHPRFGQTYALALDQVDR